MSGLYAPAQIVTDPSDCFRYHVMDLPEIGTVQGAWDLRETIDDYLGHVDFSGKRCLDFGAASGYLSFEMERRGAAEVVSVDLDPATHAWEIVPFAGRDLDQARGQMAQDVRAWQRAYWLAHRLLGFDINLPKGDGRYAALRLCHQLGAAVDPRDVESSLAEPLGEPARSTRHIKARPQPAWVRGPEAGENSDGGIPSGFIDCQIVRLVKRQPLHDRSPVRSDARPGLSTLLRYPGLAIAVVLECTARAQASAILHA